MFVRSVFISFVFIFLQNFSVSSQGSNYIFYLESDATSLNTFLDILKSGLDEKIQLKVKNLERLSRKKNIYGVLLADSKPRKKHYRNYNTLSNVIVNILPKGEALWLKLVYNSRGVLIADARKRVIDVADISKFSTHYETHGVYLSAAILLHELYEQFYLQHIARTEPGRATDFQLAQAHIHANQREGSYYHRGYQKDISKVYPGFILIRFNSLNDDSSILYRAYYRKGNIYRVDSEYL